MGNRAVITFSTAKSAPCIYLHWNGGRCSVEAILLAARHLNLNAPMQGAGDGTRFDTQAKVLDAVAKMVKKWCSSVYRETYANTDTDNGDNGVYIINDELEIVGRVYAPRTEYDNEEKKQGVYQELIKLNAVEA